MKTLSQQLIMYAKYHRDPRNIVTHFIGIPMIVFAVAVLLSRAAFDVAGVSISLAHIVVACMGVYYLVLNLKLGVLMVALLGACIVGADKLALISLQ